MSVVEPILQENKDRFVIFPIKHQDIWEWYKKQEACIWTAEEIDLHTDLNDWNNKLSEDEKFFIKHINHNAGAHLGNAPLCGRDMRHGAQASCRLRRDQGAPPASCRCGIAAE